MDRDTFFRHYPLRSKYANKFTHGRLLFISGSHGMAGACILNLIGARCTGVSFVHAVVPESIYPIVAGKEITTVFHPDECRDPGFLKQLDLYDKVDAIAFGSGLDRHPFAREYLIDVLKDAKVPVVVDAKGLRLLAEDASLYELPSQMILTPHLGEFSALCHLPIETIKEDRERIAIDFAANKKVTLVLKGPDTLIVSREGSLYHNESGNEALARAGSGDVLTGMICGLCALYEDKLQAVRDAVWLHGHLCDETVRNHSKELFDLTAYPQYAEAFFDQK